MDEELKTTGFGICPECREYVDEIGDCMDGEDNAYFVCEGCDLSWMMDYGDDYTCHSIVDASGCVRDVE